MKKEVAISKKNRYHEPPRAATWRSIRRGEHFARPCYGGVMPAFAPSDGLLFTCHCGGGSTFVGVDEIEQMIATMKGTEAAALAYCEANGLRVLALWRGPDGSVRGIARTL